jgi:hypothetical protein
VRFLLRTVSRVIFEDCGIFNQAIDYNRIISFAAAIHATKDFSLEVRPLRLWPQRQVLAAVLFAYSSAGNTSDALIISERT